MKDEPFPVLSPPGARSRARLALGMLVVIAVGLASRRYPLFPAALGKYPGDALWALMIFLGLALLRPHFALRRLAGLALVICYAVEFAQLIQVPWLSSIRASTLGHLVLGSAFDRGDLYAYAIGVLAGVALLGIDRSVAGKESSPPFSGPAAVPRSATVLLELTKNIGRKKRRGHDRTTPQRRSKTRARSRHRGPFAKRSLRARSPRSVQPCPAHLLYHR